VDGSDRGEIGSECREDADCEDGLTCYKEVEGGYCTVECSTGSCPEGTECSVALGTQLCVPACTSHEDCDVGACVGGGCVPACESDSDCGDEGSGYVCENGGCVQPTIVRGEVYDSETLEPIAGARVVVIDGDTMAAAAPVAVTDAGGTFSQRVVLREDQESMGFTLRVAAEGYMPFPDPPLRPAIPEQVYRFGSSDVVPVALIHDVDLEDLGSIAGTVTLDGIDVGGVLVVISGAEAISTVTDVDGTYVMLNVPDGDWDVSALAAGMTRGEVAGVEVMGGAAVTGVDMALSTGPAGSVSGTCNFVAGGEAPASVVLIYPPTLEAVPGLHVETSGGWSIEGVPDGTYDIYATYDNDCNVQDPDSQLAHTAVKTVTVAGGPVTVDEPFNVTDAVDMTGVWAAAEPCDNDDNSIIVVSFGVDDIPVFTWADYPGSTQGYAIEVLDVFGEVVWGGFDLDTGEPLVRFPNHTNESPSKKASTTAGPSGPWPTTPARQSACATSR
jgi:hypothetical protein